MAPFTHDFMSPSSSAEPALELPIEIVRAILLLAVGLFVEVNDRTSAVAVALVSHAIYKLIAPVLYRALVIHPRSEEQVKQLISDEKSRLASSFVKRLHVWNVETQSWSAGNFAWCNIELFDGTVDDLLHVLIPRATGPRHRLPASIPNTPAVPLRPRYLILRNRLATIRPSLSRLPPESLSFVTHYTAPYELPGEVYRHEESAPGLLIGSVLRMLPACTHFALDCRTMNELHFREPPPAGQRRLAPVSVATLRRAVCAALDLEAEPRLGPSLPGPDHPFTLATPKKKLKFVMLYIPNSANFDPLELSHMLYDVVETHTGAAGRLAVWFDNRTANTADQAYTMYTRDAICGRDVWSEARLLKEPW